MQILALREKEVKMRLKTVTMVKNVVKLCFCFFLFPQIKMTALSHLYPMQNMIMNKRVGIVKDTQLA